jgi:hypothetical protein
MKKLTVKLEGKIKYIEKTDEGFEIIFNEKNMDLWQDCIHLWLEEEGQKIQYKKIYISKKGKIK